MKLGMMWQRNTSKENIKNGNGLLEDIISAAETYSTHYSAKPDTVYVNPSDVEEKDISALRSLLQECCNLEMVLARYILKGNVWIGEE